MGLDHEGESVLAWDAETGKPLSPVVVWQDKRSQTVLDSLREDDDEVRESQRPAVGPVLLGGQARVALHHDDDVKKRRVDGPLRMGNVRLIPV